MRSYVKMRKLRLDLERVRLILDLIHRREGIKQELVKADYQVSLLREQARQPNNNNNASQDKPLAKKKKEKENIPPSPPPSSSTSTTKKRKREISSFLSSSPKNQPQTWSQKPLKKRQKLK